LRADRVGRGVGVARWLADNSMRRLAARIGPGVPVTVVA
jgi:hypothetical protein